MFLSVTETLLEGERAAVIWLLISCLGCGPFIDPFWSWRRESISSGSVWPWPVGFGFASLCFGFTCLFLWAVWAESLLFLLGCLTSPSSPKRTFSSAAAAWITSGSLGLTKPLFWDIPWYGLALPSGDQLLFRLSLLFGGDSNWGSVGDWVSVEWRSL